MLIEAIKFLIGPMSPTLTTAACFFGAACLANIIQDGVNKQIALKLFKKLFSYLIYLMVANRIDAMGLSLLFGWHGSTQLLVAAWIAVMEIKEIFAKVKVFGEIDIPPIIDQRLGQMQNGQVNPGYGYVDSNVLDEQIKNLKQNMEKMKELNKLQNEANQMNSSIAAGPIYIPPVDNIDPNMNSGINYPVNNSQPTI